MRTFLIVLMMTLATQAGAECDKLCDGEWWEKATTADLRAELKAGADVMARDCELPTYAGLPEVPLFAKLFP